MYTCAYNTQYDHMNLNFLVNIYVYMNTTHLHHPGRSIMYYVQIQKTPLHWACENGHEEVVGLLVSHKANIEALDQVRIYI